MEHPDVCPCPVCTEKRERKLLTDAIGNLPLNKFTRKYGHLTFGQIFEKLEEADLLLSTVQDMAKALQTVITAKESLCMLGPMSFIPAYTEAKRILDRDEVKKLLEDKP